MYAKRRKILLVALHLQPCPQVNSEADNVSPEEARGVRELQVRANEPSREKRSNDERSSLKRDPQFAEKLLQRGRRRDIHQKIQRQEPLCASNCCRLVQS